MSCIAMSYGLLRTFESPWGLLSHHKRVYSIRTSRTLPEHEQQQQQQSCSLLYELRSL